MSESSRPSMDIAAEIDERWDFDDPAATERVLRAWLEEVPDGELRDQLRTQLARTMSLQKRFDEAHALLDELDDATGLVRVRCLLERGRTLNSSGRPEVALPLFVEAWERAEGLGADFYAIDAVHMIAIVESAENATAWNERGLDMVRRTTDERARNWEGSLYNNLGWTRHEAGELDGALELFEHALAARQRQGKVGEIQVAKWCVARCLRSLGRVDEALEIQQALRAEHEAAGTADPYVEEEIAHCLEALGR